jgi:hypothetical protein
MSAGGAREDSHRDGGSEREREKTLCGCGSHVVGGVPRRQYVFRPVFAEALPLE